MLHAVYFNIQVFKFSTHNIVDCYRPDICIYSSGVALRNCVCVCMCACVGGGAIDQAVLKAKYVLGTTT